MSTEISHSTLFAVSPNPYMVLDRELRYLDANDAYLEVTGRTRDDLVGRYLFEAFPRNPADPEDTSVEQLRDSLESVLREKVTHHLALIRYAIAREIDGVPVFEERYWSATHVPVFDAAGEVSAILQHTVDVTELQTLKRVVRATRLERRDVIEGGVFERAQEVERRHARLDERHRQLRRLFEQAPGFLAVLRGPLHVFELVNESYSRLIGRRDVLGRPIREALPEIVGQGFAELLDGVFASGEPYIGRAVEVRLQQPGGAELHRCYLDFIYQPVVEADGRVSGVLVQGHDVTETQLAQRETARVHERLEQLLAERTEALELSRAEHARREAAEEALREETRMLDLLNRTGTAIASTLDLQTLLQTVTDAATEISGAQFGAFFYNTSDDGTDAYALYALSGAPREAFERFGQPRATALFGPTFRGEAPIRSDDVLADPRYGHSAPHHGMPPGHLPVRSYLAVAVRSRTGETIGGLFFGHAEPGMFSERTERLMVGVAAQAATAIDNARLYEDARRVAQAREQLMDAERAARADIERVSRMKDEFLATLSHELRTPLTAILGWAKVLQLKKQDAQGLDRGIDAIARNARAQAGLIDDLLDMSRIVSGKLRLDVQPVDLATVVEAAIESVRPSIDAKEIRLHKVLDPNAGPISGDPQRMQQVVWNLLSNAVKFTPRGGHVDVVLQRVESQLEITVRDSGCGIAPDFLPHVFERFRQADASTTRSHGGLGLGLSIVKQLVELHGGTVRADSGGAGSGATFVVRLPLSPLRGADGTDAPPSALGLLGDAMNLAGIRVLVVDDEPDTRELIRQVLAQAQADAVTAGSAADALRAIEAWPPDVVVSDIGMPGRDGYEFIRQLRRLPHGQGGRTPAIALTAFARTEDRTRAMMAGYQVHVAKPIEPAELIATVASLAGRTGGREG